MSNSPYWFSTINQQTGLPIPGASVTVYLTGTTTNANIYNSVGGAISNPMTADSNAIAAFWAADGKLYDIVWSSGSYVSETLTFGRGAALRTTAAAPVTIGVGFPAGLTPWGVTVPAAADSATSINCLTVKQALYNLANNYDHNGFTPTIQCAGPTSAGGGGSVQTYYGGLVLSFGDTPYATLTPQFVGTFMLVFDLGGSILDGAPTSAGGAGYTVCLRMCPLALQIQNGTFQQASGASSILYAYGGNAQIEIGPAVTIGQFGPNGGDVSLTGGFVMQATRGGAIRLRPGLSGANRMVINLGTSNKAASLFDSLIMGGSIELEGSEINIQGSTTFTVGVFNISNLSQVSLSNVPFTGGNFGGPQYQLQSGGNLTNNDSVGGQTMNIPANPQKGTSATTVVTNTYSSVAGSNYFPGSQPPVILGNAADVDFWPDLPAPPSNAGTGAVVQGDDAAVTWGIGSGATSPVHITLATCTNWRNVVMSCSNPGAFTNIRAAFVGPANPSTPGYIVLTWDNTYGGGALGAYCFCQLRNAVPM